MLQLGKWLDYTGKIFVPQGAKKLLEAYDRGEKIYQHSVHRVRSLPDVNIVVENNVDDEFEL